MKLITCPTSYTRETLSDIIVFLGGGISNCPNWQLDMIDLLTCADDSLVLVNPRRDSFDITDETASDFQIKWEFKHLSASDAILFWFPCETLCPITLYELGAAAHRGNPIFVGCHPDYARRFDVATQLSLVRPDIKVRATLEHVSADVLDWHAAVKSCFSSTT